MSNLQEKEEFIDLLCGEEIGSGAYRNVFECKLNKDWVVKVANDDGRQQNLLEDKIWDEIRHHKELGKWFAPVIAVSDAGKYLIMSKAERGREKDYPKKIPNFFTDTKMSNYGWIGNQFVCVDYSGTIITNGFNSKMVKAHWW